MAHSCPNVATAITINARALCLLRHAQHTAEDSVEQEDDLRN